MPHASERATWLRVSRPSPRIGLRSDAPYLFTYDLELGTVLSNGATVLVLAALFNIVPDFLSLLQTRFVIGWMSRARRVALPLALDLVATAVISIGLIFFAWGVAFTVPAVGPFPERESALAEAIDVARFAPSTARRELPVL